MLCNRFGHYSRECPNKGIHLGMMKKTTATISKATTIKGMAGSTTKEKGMLLLLNMEMVDLPKGQETPGMMNLML